VPLYYLISYCILSFSGLLVALPIVFLSISTARLFTVASVKVSSFPLGRPIRALRNGSYFMRSPFSCRSSACVTRLLSMTLFNSSRNPWFSSSKSIILLDRNFLTFFRYQKIVRQISALVPVRKRSYDFCIHQFFSRYVILCSVVTEIGIPLSGNTQ